MTHDLVSHVLVEADVPGVFRGEAHAFRIRVRAGHGMDFVQQSSCQTTPPVSSAHSDHVHVDARLVRQDRSPCLAATLVTGQRIRSQVDAIPSAAPPWPAGRWGSSALPETIRSSRRSGRRPPSRPGGARRAPRAPRRRTRSSAGGAPPCRVHFRAHSPPPGSPGMPHRGRRRQESDRRTESDRARVRRMAVTCIQSGKTSHAARLGRRPRADEQAV